MSKITRDQFTKAVLATVAIGGILAISTVAPNTVQLLKLFESDSKKRAKRHYYIKQVRERLVRQGLLAYSTNKAGHRHVKLTKKGQLALEKFELADFKLPKPKRWDGKYRLVMFDIKEWKRNTRDELRGLLSRMGFVQLQQSAWVYPYECADLIVMLKSHFKLGKEVLYLTVESLENDHWLRQEFNL